MTRGQNKSGNRILRNKKGNDRHRCRRKPEHAAGPKGFLTEANEDNEGEKTFWNFFVSFATFCSQYFCLHAFASLRFSALKQVAGSPGILTLLLPKRRRVR